MRDKVLVGVIFAITTGIGYKTIHAIKERRKERKMEIEVTNEI